MYACPVPDEPVPVVSCMCHVKQRGVAALAFNFKTESMTIYDLSHAAASARESEGASASQQLYMDQNPTPTSTGQHGVVTQAYGPISRARSRFVVALTRAVAPSDSRRQPGVVQ